MGSAWACACGTERRSDPETPAAPIVIAIEEASLADRIRGTFRTNASNLDFLSAYLVRVMVHEIIHVLEGVASHSDFGVMKAMWSDADYREIKQHPLAFAPEEVTLSTTVWPARSLTEPQV